MACNAHGFRVSIRGYNDLEIFNKLAGFGILNSINELSNDSEAAWYDTTCVATVHTLAEYLHIQCRHHASSERSRCPDLIEIETAGVQAENDSRCANAIGELLEVRSEMN